MRVDSFSSLTHTTWLRLRSTANPFCGYVAVLTQRKDSTYLFRIVHHVIPKCCRMMLDWRQVYHFSSHCNYYCPFCFSLVAFIKILFVFGCDYNFIHYFYRRENHSPLLLVSKFYVPIFFIHFSLSRKLDIAFTFLIMIILLCTWPNQVRNFIAAPNFFSFFPPFLNKEGIFCTLINVHYEIAHTYNTNLIEIFQRTNIFFMHFHWNEFLFPCAFKICFECL